MKIQPSLIPRFNYDYNINDLLYGIKSIFTKNNNDLSILSKIFGNKNFFFTNNGRSSLYIILRSLDLPAGSKVGVPLYSCTVVFDAIINAGYVPCFIDIDPENYTMDPHDLGNKINDLRAIVVLHTFGRPADMEQIMKVANGIPIIEDCAHSLLSEYKGKMTGTIGNAAFFSLGKYISAGGGGMIILNEREYEENIKRELSLLNSPTILNDINHALLTYIFSFLYHKPWFGGFAYHIGLSIENKVDIANKKGFKATNYRKSDFNIFLRKFETFREKLELQRNNSQKLMNELQNTDLVLPYERKNTRCNYFLFPILFNNKQNRNKAIEFLRRRNIDTVNLYNMTPTLARQLYGYKNDCPITEQLADRMLIIPNYYSLTDKELLDIVRAMKKLVN